MLTQDSHDWLKRHSTDFVSTDPTIRLSEAERKCVARIVGSARVIGLGEMTHGSHEIFRAKDRLLRHLVQDHNVRVIVLEANFAATHALNASVVNRQGDPEAALVETGYWSCANEETLEFVNWLAEFNASLAASEKKVKVYGCDTQSMDDTKRTLHRILRAFAEEGRISGAASADAAERLAALPSDWEMHGLAKPLLAALDEENPDTERLAEIQRKRADSISAERERASHAVARLTAIEHSLPENDASSDRFVFRRCIRLIDMCLATFGDWSARDGHMAENVLAIRDRYPGEHMVLTSGNWHIARTPIQLEGASDFVTMGSLVAERVGDEYRAIGSTFHRGRFLGVAGTDASASDVVVDAHVPRPDAWEHYFNAYAQGLTSTAGGFVLDFRTARASGGALPWPTSLRMNVGEARPRQSYEATFVPQRPHLQYDAVLFIPETTPITVLPQYYPYSKEKWRKP